MIVLGIFAYVFGNTNRNLSANNAPALFANTSKRSIMHSANAKQRGCYRMVSYRAELWILQRTSATM